MPVTDYPEWVKQMVQDHYDRIADGTENKPHFGIMDMILEGYDRGHKDATGGRRVTSSAPNGEPQAMTLEEAMLKLAETDHTLAFTDDENEPWVVVEKLEVDIATPYCRSWTEAVSHVWGYPVVERDDTAELVEALARLLDVVWIPISSAQTWDGAVKFAELDAARFKAEAALAAYEAGRK